MKDNRHFFIIGAQRSGSTYLYNILDEHPEICMARPVKPEPKFFINNAVGENIKENYYNKYFLHKNSEVVFGEKSTSYYEKTNCAERIKEAFPDAKIIIILRNPIDRTISNYFFSVTNGIEKRTIEDVFIYKIPPADIYKFSTSVSPYNYLGRSEYKESIKHYLNIFGRRKFKVLIMENFVGKINGVSKLYSFLGVSKFFIPESLDSVINSSDDKYSVPQEVISELKNYFNEQIIDLETFLNIDLSVWKKKYA